MVPAWLGSFGPAFAAVLVVGIWEGQPGLLALFARLFRWRVGVRWYLAALLPVPVVGLTISALAIVAGGQVHALPGLGYWRSTAGQHLLVWGAGVLMGAVVASGEELGWRGFALPRLQARHHPLVASLLLGGLWGLWHFNGLVVGAAAEYNLVDGLLFVAGTMSASIVYTWLFNNTQGSVLIACLFHAVYDVTVLWVAAVLPLPPGATRWGMVGLVGLAALVVVVAGPGLSYADTTRQSGRVREGEDQPADPVAPALGDGS
jgi:membrane protease YdiL (CAAX protease family)